MLSAVTQTPAGTLPAAISGSLFVLGYRNSPSNPVSFAAAIKLLDSYGNVKVLSSPKLSVMNNQTALLKVVNNIVFFNVKADTTTSNGVAQTNVTTTPQSVSVGLVMSVTPQISESESVVLNVRPMISRVTSYKSDPNPNIPTGLSNLVPEIETREMESVMRIGNGDIAVLGGLMQDSINYKDDGIPGLSKIPGLGSLFSYKNETNAKTELVIFLRPIVVREASLEGDYRSFESSLPNSRYLERSWERKPLDSGVSQ
jgi:MSHA biogenesis protein MshL